MKLHRPDEMPGDPNYSGLIPVPEITEEYLKRMKSEDRDLWPIPYFNAHRNFDILRGVIVIR